MQRLALARLRYNLAQCREVIERFGKLVRLFDEEAVNDRRLRFRSVNLRVSQSVGFPATDLVPVLDNVVYVRYARLC
jgi:hypothetical protein